MNDRIPRQLAFLAEIDKLKNVLRASSLLDGSRKENSGEHSWHLCMYALVLAPDVEGVDLLRVIKMLLVHDIVEIDAGDSPFFASNIDREALAQAEARAADRIFGLLPAEQGSALRTLWEEFEAAESVDARFAKALDRLQPLIANVLTGGGTWNDFGVAEEQAVARYGAVIGQGAPALWEEARRLIARHFAETAKKA